MEPLLPPPAVQRGGRWRDHRQVVNAILWTLRTGAPWRDLPERYGPWKTAHERLRKWTADGTWERILTEVVAKDDSIGTWQDNIAVVVSIDSTHIRHTSTPLAPAKRGLRCLDRGSRRRRRVPRTLPRRADIRGAPGR